MSVEKVWGCGKWYVIHLTSLYVNEDYFCRWIRVLTSNLECQECRGHATEYVASNAPEKAKELYNGQEHYMFRWTVEFHNAVNRRIGKEELSYDKALELFTVGKAQYDTKKWGHGVWSSIHHIAAGSDAAEDGGYLRRIFSKWLQVIITNLPNERFNRQSLEYLAKKPFIEEPSLFGWTYKFHNYINKLTGKDEVSFEIASKMWITGEVATCSACGTAGPSTSFDPTPKIDMFAITGSKQKVTNRKKVPIEVEL